MIVAKAAALAVAAALISTLAFAASPTPPVTLFGEKAANLNMFSFNYGPPQSPALNLLGISPSKATIYNSPQPFVLSLPSLIGGSGNQAVALDLAPAWAIQAAGGGPLTKGKYTSSIDQGGLQSALSRAWYRSRVELATTAGASSANAANIQPSGLAFGVSTSPVSWSDPITAKLPGETGDYFDDCLAGKTNGPDVNKDIDIADHAAIAQLPAGWTGVLTADQLKQLQNTNVDVESEISNCMQAATTVANASPDITLGLGYVAAGQPGAYRDLHSGEAFWAAGRVPVPLFSRLKGLSVEQLSGKSNAAQYLMLDGSLSYQNQTRLITGSAKAPLVDGNIFSSWAGLTFYAPRFQFAAEGGYTDTRTQENGDGKFSSSGFRWLVNGAYKLPYFSSVWLTASYGTARGSTTKLNDRTALVAIQFATPSGGPVVDTPATPQNGQNAAGRPSG